MMNNQCTYVFKSGKLTGTPCTAPARLDNLCTSHVKQQHAKDVRAAKNKGLPAPPPPDLAGAAAAAAVCMPCAETTTAEGGLLECCYVHGKGATKGSKCTTPAKLNGMCSTHVLLLHERAVKAAEKAGCEPPPKPDLAAAVTEAYQQSYEGGGVANDEGGCKGQCQYMFTKGKAKGTRCKITSRVGGLCTKHMGTMHKRTVLESNRAGVEAPPPPDTSMGTRNRHGCTTIGCEANVQYGFANTPATKCEAHREPGQRWRLKSMCKCGHRPHYGFVSDEWATCCKACADPGMVNIANARCGCPENKIPSFAFQGEPAVCCKACKEEGMVDVMSMKCIGCNLPNGPSFGMPGDEIGRYCGGCKTPEMVNLKHDRCAVCKVAISPSYGYPFDEKPTVCADCCTGFMVDLKHKMCKCGTYATFGMPCDERASYCRLCSTDEMVDVRHKTCAIDGCGMIANSKYDGHCFRCFIETHPECEITLNYRVKEFSVVEFIKVQFPDVKLLLNKSVGVSKRRPDILITLTSHVVIIEVDEHRHCCYSDEAERLAQLYQDLGGTTPMHVIRFNPDAYIEAVTSRRVNSCWGVDDDTKRFGVVSQAGWDERLCALKGVVRSCIDNPPVQPISEVRLFYGAMVECDPCSDDDGLQDVPFESLGLN